MEADKILDREYGKNKNITSMASKPENKSIFFTKNKWIQI
jgi:hypothetical protein